MYNRFFNVSFTQQSRAFYFTVLMNSGEIFHNFDKVFDCGFGRVATCVFHLHLFCDFAHLFPIQIQKRLNQIAVNKALQKKIGFQKKARLKAWHQEPGPASSVGENSHCNILCFKGPLFQPPCMPEFFRAMATNMRDFEF